MATDTSPTPHKMYTSNLGLRGNTVNMIGGSSRLQSETGLNVGQVTRRTNYKAPEQAMPLITSRLGNQQPPRALEPSQTAKNKGCSSSSLKTPFDNAQMEALLEKLADTSGITGISTQARESKISMDMQKTSNARVLDTPPSEYHSDTPHSTRRDTSPVSETNVEIPATDEDSEVNVLRQQLAAAREKIAYMDQELHQTRMTKQIVDSAVSTPESEEFTEDRVSEQTISHLQNALNLSTDRTNASPANWHAHQNFTADHDGIKSGGLMNATQPAWGNAMRTSLASRINMSNESQNPYTMSSWSSPSVRPWSSNVNPVAVLPSQSFGRPMPSMQRPSSGFRAEPIHNLPQAVNEQAQLSLDAAIRRTVSNPPTRPGSAFDRMPGWNAVAPGIGYSEGTPHAIGHLPAHSMWQGASQGSSLVTNSSARLSATAAEFNADNTTTSVWNSLTTTENSSGYASSMEPMNYRRLLDKNMNCNWKCIVDKILCNNDQQASIFLQQKLKVGTADQKFDIVEAIIAQAYPLMINRFGNFLVQRCFEHGTADQIISIANAIRGKTLQLSMDAFGCHVVQKAFDAVPEEYKAIMVHELLRRIPETVIHRYACHVWQKLFELRWSDSPPQIMKYVNEALRGMWHEVALGETGSLVVQNIFENCLEEDKRPCVDEVLSSIDVISHGQFGNWCVQHICEHGGPTDRCRAVDHILRFATEYSMDQYASKVIEKCLKIGGSEFLDRYLERVCEGRPDRPRMPLIDIAGDQFGNYLIQWILTNATPQHREIVAAHIRKHMVSLRGSKYGSRVAMLCCNPAIATRPGPPTNIPVGRFSNGVARSNFAVFR